MLAGGGAAAAAPGGMDMACCIAAALALVLLLPLGCWIRWGVAFSLALLFFEVVKPGEGREGFGFQNSPTTQGKENMMEIYESTLAIRDANFSMKARFKYKMF
jgi:hypothetical protein